MKLIQKTLKTQTNTRKIARRTRGRNHGAITRLMNPSDFGRLLKPFVFLDLFEHQGEPFYLPLKYKKVRLDFPRKNGHLR